MKRNPLVLLMGLVWVVACQEGGMNQTGQSGQTNTSATTAVAITGAKAQIGLPPTYAVDDALGLSHRLLVQSASSTAPADGSLTSSAPCEDGGTAAIRITGIDNQQTTQTTINGTTVIEFARCRQSSQWPLAEGATCSFGVALDGIVTCKTTGTFSSGNADLTFDCATDQRDSGLNITLNNSSHTVGLALFIARTGDPNKIPSVSTSGSVSVKGETLKQSELQTALSIQQFKASELDCQ